MIYLISYDLKDKASGRDYSALFDAIKSCSTNWWHYLDSVWIIKSSESIDNCNTIIKNHLGENDLLIIVDVTNQQFQGWLPSKAWEWIKTYKN